MTGRYLAVLGAAALLVVGVGGVGYGVGKVTGADIKDNSVTTADIRDRTLRIDDLAPSLGNQVQRMTLGQAAYHADDVEPTDEFAPVLSLDLPPGNFLVDVDAQVFNSTAETAWVTCYLSGVYNYGYLGQTAATLLPDQEYGTLSTQAAITTSSPGAVSLSCSGRNIGLNQIILTATPVDTLDLQ